MSEWFKCYTHSLTHTHTHTCILLYIYMYMSMCVCVCVCVLLYITYRDVIECELKSTDELEDPARENTELIFRTEEEGVV
jgi:hypothetical protein